jgi:peptidoglycan/LPS O-acetylase OafA/YrhL
MKMQKNPAISLSRVTGMIMIVLCHIIKYYTFVPGHQILGEFFNCGVQLFIFISGYLYGGKIINSFRQWFKARFLTVSLPAILIAVFTIIALLIAGETVSVQSMIAYVLDAEGLLFLNWNMFSKLFDEIPSLGPLWFTTVIMLCYLLVPALQSITQKIKRIRLLTILLFVIGAIASIALAGYLDIIYFCFFAVGYCLGKIKILDRISTKRFLIYTGLFLASLAGRLLLQRFFDNTALYHSFVPLSRFVIGTWFVVFYSYINHMNHSALSAVGSSKIIKLFSDYSYYVYLVHGILCMGLFNVYDRFSTAIASLLFLFGTISIAVGLKYLSDLIKNFKIWNSK